MTPPSEPEARSSRDQEALASRTRQGECRATPTAPTPARRAVRWFTLVPHALSLLAGVLLTTGQAAEPWTLERAIDHALASNPDARIAHHRVAAAEAGLQQANAAFWPQVRLGASYVRTDNPMQVFGAALNQEEVGPTLDFNNVPDADNLNAHGLVTLPLYRGGQSAAGRQQATAGRAAARHTEAAVHNLLAGQVARAFFTVTKTRAFIQATEAAVQAFESNLTIARKRHAAGTALKLELLDVEVRLGQAREDLVRARHANALAHQVLRNLLALEAADFEIAETAPALAVPKPEVAPERAELAATAAQRQAAEAALRQARGGYRPRADAFARYDVDHGWKFNGTGDSYTAGVVLQWELWDGQQTRGRIREARAGLDTADERERQLRLAIDLEVTQARLRLREAEERLAVTATSITQATESAQLTRARFEQGLALSSQLIDAETALTTARVRRAEAEADRQIAVAALRQALGLPQTHDAHPPH